MIIRDGCSIALYTACTVDTVYTIDMVLTGYIVYTVDTNFNDLHCEHIILL